MAENKLITLKNLESIAKALDNKTKSLVVAEMDRASGAEAEILDAIAAVESMLGGKSIVYKTQEEYDNLSDEEKDDDTVTYFITDAEDTSHKHENPDVLDALTAEDVEVIKSVGETLENLEKELFDVEAKTIELDVYKADKKYVDEKIAALNVASNDVFQNNVSNGKLELTLDKYQIATISSGTEIVFPETLEFIGKSAFANCTALKTFVYPILVKQSWMR